LQLEIFLNFSFIVLGYELASFFTKTVFEETNKRPPNYDSIIHLMCRQLQNLGVLETTTETYNDLYYQKEPLFKVSFFKCMQCNISKH